MYLSILANMVGPYIGYKVLRSHGWSEVGALTALTVIPVVWGLGVLARTRKVDAMAAMSLIGMLLSLVACLLTSDVRTLQIRDSFTTLLFGLAFLVSALIGRPVLAAVVRAKVEAETDPEIRARKEAWLNGPRGRAFTRTLTVGWGLVSVSEFVTKLVLIYTLRVETVLGVSPWIMHGLVLCGIVWSIWLGRREERLARAEKAARVAATSVEPA